MTATGRAHDAGFIDEIAAVHGGYGNGPALLEAFRRSVVLVPRHRDGGVPSLDHGGVRWLLAFTGEGELAAFAAARSEDTERSVDCLTVRGERLLDAVVPALGVPAGVAVDIAGKRPMFLPPLSGIVPEEAALDRAVPDRAGAS